MEASHTYRAEGSRIVFQYPSSSQTVLEAEDQNINLDLMLDFVESHFRDNEATIISCKKVEENRGVTEWNSGSQRNTSK